MADPIDTDAETLITCAKCNTINRVRMHSQAVRPICASCKTRLDEQKRAPSLWRWRNFRLQTIPAWAYALCIILALNIAIIGTQKLWHWDDEQRLENLTADITMARLRVDRREKVSHLLAQEITAMVTKINSGDASYDERNALIAHYNDKVSRYQAAYANYSAAVDAANRKIAEANALSEKIGGTWFLIPLPGVSAHH